MSTCDMNVPYLNIRARARGDEGMPTQRRRRAGTYGVYACCIILRTMSRNQCRESRFQSDGPSACIAHMSCRKMKRSARGKNDPRIARARWIRSRVRVRARPRPRPWRRMRGRPRAPLFAVIVVDSVPREARLVKMAWTDRALLRLSRLSWRLGPRARPRFSFCAVSGVHECARVPRCIRVSLRRELHELWGRNARRR